MRIFLWAALGLAITQSTALADPAPLAEEAMRRGTRGHIIIDVEINGQGPYAFLVDSGAQASVAFPNLIEALDLPEDAGPAVQVQGASELRRTAFYQIDSVTIGNRDEGPMRVVSAPDGTGARFADYPTYGILGANILNAYSVEFDFEAGTLRLFDAETDFSDYTAGWDRADYTLNPFGFATFPVQIDETATTAILDLGASRHTVNAVGFEALGFDPEGEYENTAPAHGLNGQPVELPLVGDRSLSMGSFARDDVEIALMDSPVFGMLGLGDQPAMLLGLPLFEGRALLFDRAGQQLVIGPQAG